MQGQARRAKLIAMTHPFPDLIASNSSQLHTIAHLGAPIPVVRSIPVFVDHTEWKSET